MIIQIILFKIKQKQIEVKNIEETGNNEQSLTDISRGVEILRRVRERHEKYGSK